MGLFAVDVREAVLVREGSGDQHLPGVPERIRIGGERGHRASDELGDSELVRSRHAAASITFSVRTSPG